MTGPVVAGGRSVVRVVLWIGLLIALAVGGLVGHAMRDRHQFVDADRLQGALLTFRPPDRDGSVEHLEAADLAPESSTRTSPNSCRSLALLTSSPADGGGSWRGVSGDPVQPVSTLTVRFADAGDARAELRVKRLALLRCATVELTFPPFDQPAESFTVRGRVQPTLLAGDALSYTLAGKRRYSFYVRRYGNTLTWAYGATESGPATRRAVVDDLARALAELAAEDR